MEVRCKELRARAREQLKGNYGKSLGASFVGSLIGGIGMIFTSGPMEAGVVNYYVKQQRGENPEFSEIFDGFSNYGRTFCGALLRAIFIWLWSMIPIAGFIIGGLIKPFSYSMMYYVMRDFDLGANDAITKSRELMNGYKWKLFKLEFSFIGWAILASLTFGIGMIFLAPYMAAAEAEFYAELLKCNGITLGSSEAAE